ncbi:hypothetical protein MK805_16480 [Shimazuella sp. AN120528]|uniref:hypothetical protein n=1 Tax=Shimazuella soli TaxID=1892854 RepID=UPI001F11469F|nr:hypothetical protein [Shimazuella soli]MCH5586536.1 hypothetical protein [Shimazuella soli]
MFILTIISFFIFALSGLQLVTGGYILAGIPTLAVSGIVPVFISFWRDRRRKKHKHKHSKAGEAVENTCDTCDFCSDCGCD